MYSWPSVPPPLVAEPIPYWLKSEILWFAVNIKALPDEPLNPKSIIPVNTNADTGADGWLNNSTFCKWQIFPLAIPQGALNPNLAISPI